MSFTHLFALSIVYRVSPHIAYIMEILLVWSKFFVLCFFFCQWGFYYILLYIIIIYIYYIFIIYYVLYIILVSMCSRQSSGCQKHYSCTTILKKSQTFDGNVPQICRYFIFLFTFFCCVYFVTAGFHPWLKHTYRI